MKARVAMVYEDLARAFNGFLLVLTFWVSKGGGRMIFNRLIIIVEFMVIPSHPYTSWMVLLRSIRKTSFLVLNSIEQ